MTAPTSGSVLDDPRVLRAMESYTSALQRGERPNEEMERKLDTLLSQIQSKPSYQRLLVAQENFDKVMSRVNDWILEGIEKGATSSIITL